MFSGMIAICEIVIDVESFRRLLLGKQVKISVVEHAMHPRLAIEALDGGAGTGIASAQATSTRRTRSWCGKDRMRLKMIPVPHLRLDHRRRPNHLSRRDQPTHIFC